MPDLLVRGGTVVTCGPVGVVEGDLYVADGRIVAVGTGPNTADEIIDASGMLVVPGFVQAHVHLCQTLFRGLAADMDVVDWLRNAVWPLELAHTASTMRASARLGVGELLLSGTTTLLTMESIHHTDEVFAAADDLGIRATIGKALMDRREPGTDMLGESTDAAISDLERLLVRWHNPAGRLRVAVSPRAPRSATPELWKACVTLAEEADTVLHTHVNENAAQAERVAHSSDGRDVEALERWGALNRRLVMAHAVWLDPVERVLIRRRRPHICHCPTANLKLASGVAPVPELLADGINVALGSDGAACNDRLDIFAEMRLAAMIHEPRCGPGSVTAQQAVHMATVGGAAALGLADRIGTLEVGKAADIVCLRQDLLHLAPTTGRSPYDQIVYACTPADVDTVIIDGKVVVRGHRLLTAKAANLISDAEHAVAQLVSCVKCS